ncbi:hypothetical protein CRUP_024565 [Coryphaenoides rupestris]|nr:hypothetical protein CRUP_024565 [Coryphaenoides rupestris]
MLLLLWCLLTPLTPADTQGTPADTQGTPLTPPDTQGTPLTPADTQGTPAETQGTPLTPPDTQGTPLTPADTQGTPLTPADTQGTPADTQGTPLTPPDTQGTPLTPADTQGTPADTQGTPLTPADTQGTPLTPADTPDTQGTPLRPAVRHDADRGDRRARVSRIDIKPSVRDVTRRPDAQHGHNFIDHTSGDTSAPPLPRPLGQAQTHPGPVSGTSDHEGFSPPDLSDLTPSVPGSRRPKWRPLRNPFYPLSAAACGLLALTAAAVLIFSVGVLGNVALMCIVCHNYHMRSISNSLLASLAFWDFLVLFSCLPLVLFQRLTQDWLLGELSCRIIPYLEVASLGVTTFTLCALCIDRLRCASGLHAYQPVENATSTAAKLAVIWAGALLLALPELLLRQLLEEEGAGHRCVVRVSTRLPDTLYVLGLTYAGARLWWCFGCYFCLPTVFTICCSLAAARRIRRAEAAVARGDQPGRDRRPLRAESRMNCAVVSLALLYGFCSVPENICNVLSAYMAPGISVPTMDVLHLVSQMLLFCKSAASPLLVFSLCRPFRQAFGDCCCCCWEQCSDTGADRAPGDDHAPGDGHAPADDYAPGDDHGDEPDVSTARLELWPLPCRQLAPARYTAADMHC